FSSDRASSRLVLHSFPTRRSSDLVVQDGLTTPPFLSVGEPGRCFSQFRHEGASGCIRFPGLGQLPHDRAVMAENFPQLPHQVKRSEEHTSELQSRENLVCRLLLEK